MAQSDRAPHTLLWFLAPVTIFLAALFLFEVEPLIAKMILPWFGGSAEVWTACLLFFQAALLGGYLYAHLVSTRLSPAWQARLHIGLLVVSLVWLPIIPAERWKPLGGENPLPLILGLLAATIGLPFLLLSSTSPLVQAWLARARSAADIAAGRTPYRLFALSNLGSMLALLSYPILVEPNLPTRMQGWLWSGGYVLFALFAAATAWRYRMPGTERAAAPAPADNAPAPSLKERLLWLALAAAPSALLLGITNHMLRNIAAIPLLWVLPLALYLASFILSFDSPRWYMRKIWYVLFILAMGAMIYFVATDIPFAELRFKLFELFRLDLNFSDATALVVFYSLGLFICCMVCHGELAALKPSPRHLTAFYLSISAGGAAGGLFVAAVAPELFNGYYELPVLLPATALLGIYVAWRRYGTTGKAWVRWAILVDVLVLLSADTGYMTKFVVEEASGNLFNGRNFYGALQVTDYDGTEVHAATRELQNGTILHGAEFIASEMRRYPLTYYAPVSGIGAVIEELKKDGPMKVGTIGLGAGTISAYGRKEDTYVFYDINPMVETIARKIFWYLSLFPGHLDIDLGDARLSLERQPPQQFDVLAIDAFSSDAIPIHLLTKEAMALYWRHLKPDGVLAVHVSNKYVDLAPIVALAAEGSGKDVRIIRSAENNFTATAASDWVLITSRPYFFGRSAMEFARPVDVPAGLKPWTDDYSNLWQVLR